MENDSERVQPKGCVKTNKNLTSVQIYWDEAKTKPWYEYHVDQFGKAQGEYKSWFENGRISSIYNFKDGRMHGKYQDWRYDERRWYIDTNHFKKGRHGTKIIFKYE